MDAQICTHDFATRLTSAPEHQARSGSRGRPRAQIHRHVGHISDTVNGPLKAVCATLIISAFAKTKMPAMCAGRLFTWLVLDRRARHNRKRRVQ